MKIARFARAARPRASDEGSMTRRESGGTFTPGQFFREAGTLIAVCLAVGLLTRILLG